MIFDKKTVFYDKNGVKKMNNKILMSLVAASIAAMAAAPSLMKEDGKTESKDSKDGVIKLSSDASKDVKPEVKAELQNQVNAMLAKKTPITKMSESISVLVDNYGDDQGSIKNNIYKELKLGVSNDSTSVTGTPGALSQPGAVPTQSYNVCHSACHGACHSACHGSRGWR